MKVNESKLENPLTPFDKKNDEPDEPPSIDTAGRALAPAVSRVATRKRATTPESSQAQIERFNRFWDAYPKRRARGDAEKAWAKIKPDEQLLTKILAGLEIAKTSEDWAKENAKYVPYPATWLNRRGWEDDLSVKTESNSRMGWTVIT